MAETPDQQSGQPDASDGGGFSQADIDALINGTGGATAAGGADEIPAFPEKSGVVSQDDVDPLSKDGDASEESETAPGRPAPEPRVDSMEGPVKETAGKRSASAKPICAF